MSEFETLKRIEYTFLLGSMYSILTYLSFISSPFLRSQSFIPKIWTYFLIYLIFYNIIFITWIISYFCKLQFQSPKIIPKEASWSSTLTYQVIWPFTLFLFLLIHVKQNQFQKCTFIMIINCVTSTILSILIEGLHFIHIFIILCNINENS